MKNIFYFCFFHLFLRVPVFFLDLFLMLLFSVYTPCFL